MSSSINVYTGLPGTGKTSALIERMQDHQKAKGRVQLFLSSESSELTRRPNVKPGGLMGCRSPGLSFPIDHVCSTEEASSILQDLSSGVLAVFDEAQFFKPEIVESWESAAKNGIDVLVASPSDEQLEILRSIDHVANKMRVECSQCKKVPAEKAAYTTDIIYPLLMCNECHKEFNDRQIGKLLEDVKAGEPFPGELHTYQPFYGVDMSDWQLVRGDSHARLDIIKDAVSRSSAVSELVSDTNAKPVYLDLGCCSGYFADGMSEVGFRSFGVDVGKHFIEWGTRLAIIKGRPIAFLQSDAYQFIHETNEEFDVASTFATIQWVMVQKDYKTGIECFKKFFEKTKHVAIVEMGYTTEDIYKDKIDGCKEVIDKDWVLNLMKQYGNFATIEVHHAGENGIWRDVFVGFREVPTSHRFRQTIESEMVDHASDALGLFEDGWVAPTAEAYFRALKTINYIKLEGWVPEDSSQHSKITLMLNGNPVATASSEGSKFHIEQSVHVAAGESFGLRITCSSSIEAPGDSRELSFVLKTLSFL